MRRSISWAGGRLMNAGMAVSVQQDKAVAAMAAAAAAAAGCGGLQQPWQRKASAAFSTRRYGFETAFTLKSVFGSRRSQQAWARKCAIPFDGASDFCTRDFSQEMNVRRRVHSGRDLKAANAEPVDEKASVRVVSSAEDGSKEISTSGNGVLQLDYAAAMLPHPEKASRGGEDAYFMEGSWMGVADGVGGWAMEGVDSGLFSREFMGHCKTLAGACQGKPNPKDVLVKAASSTTSRGSATVLVAALYEQTLYAANLGDAGFLVVRDWEVIASSKPMQHDFNYPFQVGVMGDPPCLAQTFEVSVCKGDIILLATDGLFDNLFSHDIVEVFKSTIGSGCGLQAAATKLVSRAQVVGADNLIVSPFSSAARKHKSGMFQNYKGGKLDDVTAVVASVA